MGESACLMHSFSYASGISNEAKQGNPMHALGDSISFGRFMSESLSWEKWSTFSHKRYVEEAERYAQPGSVAQKKAFFEAHYKSIAAKKAAALLEQANAANNPREPELEGHDSQSTIKPVDEQLELKAPSTDVDSIVNENGYNSNAELETGEVKLAESVTEHEVQNESLKQSMVSEMELGESPQMEKPLLEGLKSNHEKPEFSSSKPTVHRRVPKVPASPAKSVAPVLHRRENNVTPVTRKSTTDNSMDKNRKTPNSLHKLMYSTTAKESDNKSTAPEISPEKSAVHRRVPKVPASPAKPVAPVLPRRENNITPVTRKSAIGDSMDRKRATPRSLHQLIYSSPAKESENKVESVKKATTPAAGRRIESSRVAPSPYKASKDCKTPLRTPMMASANGVSKHPSTTPCSENKRSRTPLDPSVPGSKTTGPKWHLLSAVCSKSLSACRNKLQSPTLSVPFSLRTEERAARRKQKLEEKFNAKETPKVQLQTRLKEKAGTELRKLRQSFCFKARPLPDFYKERETSKDQINKVKAPSTHPQSPKLGRRKWSSSTLQGITSLPTVTASTKNSCPKNVFKTNSQIPNPFISLPEMMTSHENTSPNIQH